MAKRYYYKDKETGHPAYNLKEPLENILSEEECAAYEAMTEEEWQAWEAEQAAAAEAAHAAAEAEFNSPAAVAERERLAAIAAKKAELAATDYVVIKIAESDDPDEIAALRVEYADVIAHRKQLRIEINALEVTV